MSVRTFIVDGGGTTRFIKKLFVIDSGGTPRQIIKGWVIDSGGTARLVYSGQVVATAVPANEHASGFAPITLTTGVTTVGVTGGVPAYTFAWVWQSGGTGITITSPSTASTAFSGHINPGDMLTGTAQCTVTDSVGHQGVAFCNVSLTATN
jgi:hypothetical protein